MLKNNDYTGIQQRSAGIAAKKVGNYSFLASRTTITMRVSKINKIKVREELTANLKNKEESFRTA